MNIEPTIITEFLSIKKIDYSDHTWFRHKTKNTERIKLNEL